MGTIEQVIQVFVETTPIVVGYDPELVNYDNQRGEIRGWRGDVIAMASDGSQWKFNRAHVGYSEAEVVERLASFVNLVNRSIENGVKLNGTYWSSIRPAYGSQAYCDGNWSLSDKFDELHAEGHGHHISM